MGVLEDWKYVQKGLNSLHVSIFAELAITNQKNRNHVKRIAENGQFPVKIGFLRAGNGFLMAGITLNIFHCVTYGDSKT